MSVKSTAVSGVTGGLGAPLSQYRIEAKKLSEGGRASAANLIRPSSKHHRDTNVTNRFARKGSE